ncbi:hypothetical protein AMATHDRAFT_137906 [Amanita thiersii Skay4041]|uniref:Major facilitator superfamily (MFS) profile domain-containing protein n=1 Tax=Amanita thiersii Skay4041 TaxID=703135 RepID=A0A2A9NVA2_9AGAR|nr:hypothetical protein AMATHDRAFT_137906 [Amanita thiersii Skay4041]
MTKTLSDAAIQPQNAQIFDIEHVPVRNDPRKWSHLRKNLSLFLVSAASMIAGLAGNIQNPAVAAMQEDLHATSDQFSLSISNFILIQGLVPLAWSAISEVKGRKMVYLASLAMFTAGSVAVSLSPTMQMVIGFRCIQAAGSSAVITIGAATLADIFDTEERGTKMGIYYMAPLLGPAIGPIFGGVLTTGFNWRAIFWFLTIFSGVSFMAFLLLFKDTFRKERSLLYQNVLKAHLKELATNATPKVLSSGTSFETDVIPPLGTKSSGEHTIVETLDDLEKLPEVNLTWKDVSPIKPLWLVLRRWNNIVILLSSGLSFAFNFMITYSSSRTLGFQYQFNPLKIGFVILAYGIGCMVGSLVGGPWSDYTLAKLKAANEGKSYPEMRLHSTFLGVVMLPPVLVALGWISKQKVHVAAICVFLFLNGFFSIWAYTSMLAYIVDSNKGRSSTAVATNSAFRGIFAFIGTEVVVPMQDNLGDGWMMVVWGILMLVSGLLLLLVYWKGKTWREKAEAWEARE